MSDDNLVSKRLRESRKSKGMTQQELAELLQSKYGIELGGAAISMYETGARRPSTEMYDAFREIFGVSVDWLRGHSEIKNPAAVLVTVESDALEFAQKISELPNGLRRTLLQSADKLLEGYKIVWRANMKEFSKLRETLELKGELAAWEQNHGINLPDE